MFKAVFKLYAKVNYDGTAPIEEVNKILTDMGSGFTINVETKEPQPVLSLQIESSKPIKPEYDKDTFMFDPYIKDIKNIFKNHKILLTYCEWQFVNEVEIPEGSSDE